MIYNKFASQFKGYCILKTKCVIPPFCTDHLSRNHAAMGNAAGGIPPIALLGLMLL